MEREQKILRPFGSRKRKTKRARRRELAQMQVEQWAQEQAQQMPMHGQFDPDFFHNNFINPEQVNPVVDEGAALDNHLFHHIAALEAGLDGLDDLDDSDDSDPGLGVMLPDGNEDDEPSGEYDSASETHEDVFHDWMPGEEPNVTEERCFVCLTPTWELINSNIRYFQDKFCICTGAVGTSCEPCIKQEIKRVPTACQVCKTPWRPDQLRFVYGRMSYTQLVVWLRSKRVFVWLALSIALPLTFRLFWLRFYSTKPRAGNLANSTLTGLTLTSCLIFFVASFLLLETTLLPIIVIALYAIFWRILPIRGPVIDVMILGD